jgi:hypothetical protein
MHNQIENKFNSIIFSLCLNKSQLFSLSCGICNVEFLSFFPYPVEFLIFFSLSCGICHVELHKAEYMPNTCTGEIPLLTIEKLVTFRVLFLNENNFCSCLPQFFYVLSQNRYIWQILIHLTTMINFFITIFILTTFFRYS